MLIVAAGLIALMVLEIFVIVQVVHLIGVLLTVALLVGVSAVGARVCARQGLAAVRRVRARVDERRLPAAPLLDGLWILLAGLLLLVPGFVTDALALLLLLPPVRAVANRITGMVLLRRFAPTPWGT